MRNVYALKALTAHGYRLENQIGEGASSLVYLVTSEKYNTPFVIKQVSLIEHPEIKRELDIHTKLNHPNIVTLYEYFEEENYVYVILEYCPGRSLKEVIESNMFEEKLFIPYASKIISALMHCHTKGIAHRDIKPANILIDKYGRPKLADFGLSIYFERNEYEKNKSHYQKIGSRMYISPEVIEREKFDPMKADIWALGVTFYYMFFKKVPWSIKDDVEFMKQQKTGFIPFPSKFNIKIRHLITAMLNICPEMRPSCSELQANSVFEPEISKNVSNYNKMMNVNNSSCLLYNLTSTKENLNQPEENEFIPTNRRKLGKSPCLSFKMSISLKELKNQKRRFSTTIKESFSNLPESP